MDKNIENIVASSMSNEEKLKALKSLSQDIQIAKDIINCKYAYCEECGDYYLSKSFFTENKIEQTKICTYEDPIYEDFCEKDNNGIWILKSKK